MGNHSRRAERWQQGHLWPHRRVYEAGDSKHTHQKVHRAPLQGGEEFKIEPAPRILRRVPVPHARKLGPRLFGERRRQHRIHHPEVPVGRLPRRARVYPVRFLRVQQPLPRGRRAPPEPNGQPNAKVPRAARAAASRVGWRASDDASRDGEPKECRVCCGRKQVLFPPEAAAVEVRKRRLQVLVFLVVVSNLRHSFISVRVGWPESGGGGQESGGGGRATAAGACRGASCRRPRCRQGRRRRRQRR
mmetsp:Transcript_12264/g.24225  ORF Transcript_12264/g.24225 Transcript_12264/m.24225 type:complete len:246 (+) Transcript_12264:384-1121(+)